MANQWQQVNSLFLRALDLAPGERAEFLAQACAKDEELRRDVESLLASHAQASQFLEQPLIDAAALVEQRCEDDTATDTPADDLVGRIVASYRIDVRLGAGGMGEVYKAHDLKLDRPVALKLLPRHITVNAERLRRSRLEARAASSLNHPHIVVVHDFGEDGGRPFMVTEYVAGQTLRERLDHGAIPIPELVEMAVQIASALAAAHEQGVLHRDIKPENVMVRPDGYVKVLDFGLAKLLTPDENIAAGQTETAVGVIMGTPRYMSPEQARGERVTLQSDQFSFGVLLYEMATGHPPFQRTSAIETAAAVIAAQAEPLATACPHMPSALRDIVERCLAKDADGRFPSTRDLYRDLVTVQRGSSDGHASAATPQVAGRLELKVDASTSLSHSAPLSVIARMERHRFAIAVTTCALLSILAVGWWAMFRRPVASSTIPSVAVLPFNTIGGSGEYFADGLTDALTTELGKLQGLRVIASNTAFAYRDRPTLRDVARELGVGLVVTGSVQRHDASMRINASLVNTSDGTTLWSEHFSRQVADVVTVQNEISEKIAGTLSKLVGSAPPAKSAPATRNPEAYDAYLRGLWHLKGRASTKPIVQSRANMWRSAVEEFERAVALDSEFALARAALASAYTQLFFYDSTDRGFDEKAFREIQRALAIDPNLPEAYLARAQLTWTARNRFPHEAAITDLRRALALNANLADAHLELEKVYYHIGLTDKVVEAGEQVQRLDPSQALSSSRTFRALIDAGRLEQVRLDVDRNANLGPYALGDALHALGRLQDALRLLSGSKATLPGDADYDTGTLALLGVVHARLDQRTQAERILAMVIPAAENPTALSHMHHAQFHIGTTFGLLGRKADAVRWLTKAADEGYPSYPRFSTDQSLAPLKGYPAYEALLVRLRNDQNRWLRSLSPAPPQHANK